MRKKEMRRKESRKREEIEMLSSTISASFPHS